MIQELNSSRTSTSPSQMVSPHLAMVVVLGSVAACCPGLVAADLSSSLADVADLVDPAAGLAMVVEVK